MSFRSLLPRRAFGQGSLLRLRTSPCTQSSLGQLRTFAANVSHIQNTPHLKRKLGQHLLVNEKILSQIVDAAQIPVLLHDKQQQQHSGSSASDGDAAARDDTVLRILEIGPGTGNLTSALLNASPHVQVHAIEYDTRMVERLAERFKDEQHRLTIEQKDFEEFEFASHQLLSVDSSSTGEDAEDNDGDDDAESENVSLTTKRRRASGRAARKIARLTKKSLEKAEKNEREDEQAQRVHFDACVANIPYQLSSIIISRLSNYMHRFPTHFKCAVLLVQEEFALRLLAKPGDQNYSRLSVNTALVADVTSVVNVGRAHFLPPPKVDSRVIKLVPITSRIVPGGASDTSDKLFFQKFDTMLRICFLRKNKTLRALLLSKTSRSHIELTSELRAELDKAAVAAVGEDGAEDEDDEDDEDEDDDDDEGTSTSAAKSEKDVVTERIEAALNECQLSSSRAVKIHVDQFLSLMQSLEKNGISFTPSTTRHFRD